MRKRSDKIYPIIIILGYALIVEVLLRILNVNINILPYPSIIIKDIFDNYDYYLIGLLDSLYTIGCGLIPGIIIGWLLAFLVNEVKICNIFIRPLIDISQLIPKTALLPVFLAIPLLGYSMISKILIVFLISFYPIFIDTLLGLKHIKIQYIQYFQIVSHNQFKTILHLKIPFSLPYSFNGLKTSVLYAVVGAITSEILIGKTGLGYIIDYAAIKLNFVRAYSGILLCIFIGGVLLACVNLFVKKSKYLRYANR